MHLTIWYADPAVQGFFSLATTGYGGVSFRNQMMPLDNTFTGILARRPAGTVEECDAGDARMVLQDVDRMMGLKRVRAVTVQSCAETPGAMRPGLVLSFYVFDEDEEAVNFLPDESQLRKMAEFLREQFEAYPGCGRRRRPRTWSRSSKAAQTRPICSRRQPKRSPTCSTFRR